MFSQACVKNSVHKGGGVHPPADRQSTPPPGRHPQAEPSPLTDTPWAHTPLSKHPHGQTPLHQMATAVDSMHPTGMHSCFTILLLKIA